ncbi:MAG TPA: hypothetical protein VHD36_13125 [Pirellulales bacterium]|nr:hypothetical protein [Pirellulales bacterium]
MRLALCALLLLAAGEHVQAEDYVFAGPWKTTNRKLDGVMTAIITPEANQQWQGRFFGTWQGVDFDYRVRFQGSPDHLHGTAVIEGAEYQWRGRINGELFRVNFGGDRYEGNFELKRTRLPAALPARHPTTMS